MAKTRAQLQEELDSYKAALELQQKSARELLQQRESALQVVAMLQREAEAQQAKMVEMAEAPEIEYIALLMARARNGESWALDRLERALGIGVPSTNAFTWSSEIPES